MATLAVILLNGTTADANEVMANFYPLYQDIDPSNVQSANKTGTGPFVLRDGPTLNNPTITGTTISDGSVNNGNVDIINGFDLRLFSDASVTQTAGIDGATGNAQFDGDISWGSGTAFNASLEHNNSAARAYTFPDVTGNIPSLPTAATTETGTGAIARAVSAALTTPSLTNAAIEGAGAGAATLAYANTASNRTVTIPDPGTNADFVMTESAQAVNGSKTFSSSVLSTATTGAVAATGVFNRNTAMWAAADCASGGGVTVNHFNVASNTRNALGDYTVSYTQAGTSLNGGAVLADPLTTIGSSIITCVIQGKSSGGATIGVLDDLGLAVDSNFTLIRMGGQ